MSALLPGRFQPWHKGHQALFEKALELEGYVIIAVRKLESDPYTFDEVRTSIDRELAEYAGQYEVIQLQFDRIIHGRDVGYSVTKIDLPPEIEAISATQIRNA